MTDDDEYCTECGDAEFDEDGNETHADDEYDHDFEPEEDGNLTLQDVKVGLDVLDKGIDVWNKITKSELSSNRFKVPPPKDKAPDLEIAEHPDVKAEKRHKENIKLQKIAIVTGAVVAIILGIVAISFN